MTGERTQVLIEVLPFAAAIAVFGVIYGAVATTVTSPGMVILSSVMIFSGAAQFTMVGLADAGASPAAIVMAVTVLALRHLPLSAVVLPRLPRDRRIRGLLSLALLDETVGLAVASSRSAVRTMIVVGAAAYVAWVGGTTAGALGANVTAAAPAASVVFVILFVGLAAVTCRSRTDAARAVGAGLLAVTVLLAVPGAGSLGAIVVAIGSATVGTLWRRRASP